MIHPLVDDLSALKDQELEQKARDLSSKYFMTANEAVRHQIVLILEIYQGELAKRRAKQWQDQHQKRNTDLDNLINVS